MLISLILFVIAILGGCLTLPKENRLLKWTGFSFVLLAATLSLVDAYDNNRELSATENNLENTKRFSAIANYGFYGGPIFYGPGLSGGDDLYTRLKDTYYVEDGKFYYHCGEPSETTYRQLIQDYPDFPFTYYALADCLKRRGDPGWVEYAKQAIKILDVTTSIGEHKKEHDEVKEVLTDYLKEE